MLILVMMSLLVAMFAVIFVNDLVRQNQQLQRTTDVLAQAREALIGYAASDNNRPGALPCPDLITNIAGTNTPNDGSADLYAGNECPGFVAGSNVYIGRLPWRTLGLPDLRDSSGERLWYAVSRQFARNPACMPNCPLNSDTLGQLAVTGIEPTSNAVAIILSSAATLETQSRGSANENSATNYLEGENANGSNPTFTMAADSPTFNDRLLALTNGDLMPAVEKRVAREMISILQQYKAATATSTLATLRPGIGVYPWSDRSDGNSNDWNHNRFPCGTALPVNWNTTVPSSSPSTQTPALPAWLRDSCSTNPVTGWSSVIYYAVARNKLENNGAGGCSNCTDNTLTVTNSTNAIADQCLAGATPLCTPTAVSSGSADLLLITSGAATASPRGDWPAADFNPITGYFEDAENRDNDDDNYVVPASTNHDRDRVYIVR